MVLPSIGGGAAKAQPVGRVSVRKRVSISDSAFWCFVIRAQCSHEQPNRAWDERPLCHVIPVNAFSTPRGASARCADVVPVNVSRISRWYERSLCRVVPFKVFATLCGTNARCAECGSGQRDSAERSCSYSFNVVGLCFSLAMYQCSRPTRACSGRRCASRAIGRFSAPVSVTMSQPFINGGAANAQSVGRVSVRTLVSITNGALWCFGTRT